MTKSERREQEETEPMLFDNEVDSMFKRNSPCNIITIECGSWMSLCEYVVNERPTTKQATDFSDYAKSSPRFRCLQTGEGVIRVEIRRDNV